MESETVLKSVDVAHENSVLKKSKKPNIPLALRTIQWIFPRVEKLAPRIAEKWFINLFFSPPRFPIPANELKFIEEAERFELSVWDNRVRCYKWGTQGPVVFFVHGWAGRSAQFKTFIPFFTNAGYQVVAFDAPAHGLTKGKKTTIIDFKNTLLALRQVFGKPHAVIAHSLDGAACLYAITEGMDVSRLVTLSTPTSGDQIIKEFSTRLGASSSLSEALQRYIKSRLHKPFDEFMASHFVQQLNPGLRWLIVHDTHDREAPVENALSLKDSYPDASILITERLGHVRILKDEDVITKSLLFISC
ncbi:alpha/beta hydrolase [Pseudochryseolinea flava]|uniref:AB hydrolase-1 domain-containing protein n=1 Tax=Pseudochryseolinea flava TaxID=2059302 RepID=A0A364Y488_9BACT|nr:alpha/beta hydrolase [Pseudochryseolinea flava]RAW01742.1 hypothetical protein DQQ10_08830 [Pseudochryseolinea flava]